MYSLSQQQRKRVTGENIGKPDLSVVLLKITGNIYGYGYGYGHWPGCYVDVRESLNTDNAR